MAQALKLANNFLSATALAATSEAIAFGTSVGLDMATMLEVLNASSGQSAATSDKFVNHVLTGTLRVRASPTRSWPRTCGSTSMPSRPQGGPDRSAEVTADVWARFADDEPGADFTRIYPFTRALPLRPPVPPRLTDLDKGRASVPGTDA